jgi:hypothetical protein
MTVPTFMSKYSSITGIRVKHKKSLKSIYYIILVWFKVSQDNETKTIFVKFFP